MGGRRIRRMGTALVLGATLSTLAFHAKTGWTQSEADLAAARKLFGDAIADEEASRFDTALEKFRRVEAVKDTANVRYRIATCLQALGRRAEAVRGYEGVVQLGTRDKTAADAVHASEEQLEQLANVVPRLSIVLPADLPARTTVRVDDVPVELDTLAEPLPLDPGRHTIAADAPGRTPFRTNVTLPEGGTVRIAVLLEPMSPSDSPNPASVEPSSRGLPGSSAPQSDAMPPPARPMSSLPAYALLGAGGLLAAGAVVSFLLRSSNLDTIHHDCAASTAASGPLVCQNSRENEVTGARNAALVEGPIGIGLAAGATLAVGAGLWLLLTSGAAIPKATVAWTPAPSALGGVLLVTGGY